MIRCNHIGCNGSLELYQNPKRENALLFKCSACQCIFSLINVRKEVSCPSLKTKSLSKSESPIKRGRGRPRKVKESD